MPIAPTSPAAHPLPPAGADWPELALQALALASGVLVTVAEVRGSAPRGPGTCMLVQDEAVWGTIGGGHLEFEAMAHARGLLAGQALPDTRSFALGPSLGQCCGGAVRLSFERVDARAIPSLRPRLLPPATPVALFGGGHVGHALVQALLPLPFDLHWIDSREGIFPADLPARVRTEHAEPVQSAVPDLAPGSHVLIMSFSHAEDLDILIACLQRQRRQQDLAMIGLIGSQTKWATFRHRLEARGFAPDEIAAVTCPIGLPGITGKAPAVIAASVAAQLLMAVG